MSTLLDVPLSEKEEQVETPPPPPRRRGLLWILALAIPVALLAGGVAGYLWPRTSPPMVSLSTTLADFGEQRGGAESPPVTVEVANDGEAPLEVQSLEVTGHDAEEFQVVGDGCTGRAVPGGERCALALQFSPVPAEEVTPTGERRTASLRLRSNASNGQVTLPLVGVRVMPRLEAIPSAVDFGRRPGGAPAEPVSVSLVNRGSARVRIRRVSLEGEATADFLMVSNACSSAVLEPGESCRVRVTSTPRRPGTSEAELRIASDASSRPLTVALSSTTGFAEPSFETMPETLDFGELRPGAAAPEQTLEVRNSGDEPLTVRRVAMKPESSGFSVTRDGCTAEPMPPGQTCEIVVGGTLSGEGREEAALLLVYTRPGNSDDGERRVPVTGRGAVPRLELEPTSLDLGRTPVGGTGSARTVRVENRGSASVTVGSVRLDGSGASAFLLEEECSDRELEPSDGCTARVRFRPVREGREQARLSVQPRDDGLTPATATVAGEGLLGRPRVEPERVDFGRARVTRRVDRRLTVRNVGNAPLRLERALIKGPAAADFRLVSNDCARSPLTPEAACSLTVRFAPGSSGGGDRSAVLRLEHDGAGPTPGESSVALTGAALPAPRPELAAAPSSLGFGDLAVGERSGIQTVTVRNPGTARLNLHALRVEGPQAEDFQIVPATCDGTPFLAPGGDCAVGVRFLPTAVGERRARLVVSGDGGVSPQSVALTGRGF